MSSDLDQPTAVGKPKTDFTSVARVIKRPGMAAMILLAAGCGGSSTTRNDGFPIRAQFAQSTEGASLGLIIDSKSEDVEGGQGLLTYVDGSDVVLAEVRETQFDGRNLRFALVEPSSGERAEFRGTFDGRELRGEFEDRTDRQLAPSFFAFDERFRGGVRLSAADLDGAGALGTWTGNVGDTQYQLQVSGVGFGGTRDLEGTLTATGPGGGPRVNIFDGQDWLGSAAVLDAFFAYDPLFRRMLFEVDGQSLVLTRGS